MLVIAWSIPDDCRNVYANELFLVYLVERDCVLIPLADVDRWIVLDAEHVPGYVNGYLQEEKFAKLIKLCYFSGYTSVNAPSQAP